MRTLVLWLVIAISVTVDGVSGNLFPYPGRRFSYNNNNNNNERSRPRFKKYDPSNYNYNNNYHPNTNPNLPRFKQLPPTTNNVAEDYDVESVHRRRNNLPTYENLPETIQQLRQIINWEREQLNENRMKILHNNDPVYRFDLERADYGRDIPIKADEGDYWNNNNNMRGVASSRLDEARMYPQDDDFGFENDNIGGAGEENEDVEIGNDEEGSSIVLDPASLNRQYHVMSMPPSKEYGRGKSGTTKHYGIKNGNSGADISETFPSGRFNGVKVVADPNEFAYAPPNPKFYRTMPTTASATPIPPATDRRSDDNVLTKVMLPQTSPKLPTSLLENDDDDVQVNVRSDLGHSGVENVIRQAVQNNDGGIITDGAEDETIGTMNVDVVAVKPDHTDVDSAGVYIIAVVAGISAAATVGLIAVGIGWYNLQKHSKNGGDIDYPAYGITGPNKDLSPTGERRLAQSAQMYHYQHQKQQIISMERVQPGERHGSVSEAESDEENEEGDYTVYECPGLAPTGEMEVKNPLFQDDPTPAQVTPGKSNQTDKK